MAETMFEIDLQRIRKAAGEEAYIARAVDRCASVTDEVLRALRTDLQTTSLVIAPLAKIETDLLREKRVLKQLGEVLSAVCRQYDSTERKAAEFHPILIFPGTAYQHLYFSKIRQMVNGVGEFRF